MKAMPRALGGAALALLLALGARAASADELSLEVAGAVAKPLHLSAAELKAIAPVTVEVTFQSGHGEEKGSFTGAPLWTLLQPAGLTDTQGNRPDLRHAIAVIGRDGYVVILAFGEIDPDFAGKSVIISYARDGKPNDAKDGLRLIVPGDKHGGRDVRDVVKIEIR
jgi:hypothetical protein